MQELKQWYGKVKYGEDNFYKLMQNRVREILLVATFYDAFIFEQDGRLSEHIYNEYKQLQLSTAPRITSVPTGKQALELLEKRQFDLVITMMRTGDVGPFELSEKARELHPDIPILLLLNVQSDIVIIERNLHRMQHIDDVFLWNGDTSIFLAMIKSAEDKLNIEHDTRQGLIRVILLVEDSIIYYSRFLPLLYRLILRQTGRLIEQERSDIDKRLRMRARPKVILAHTYEEAAAMVEKYHDNLVAVISDVRYPRNGQLDGCAGLDLIRLVKNDPFDIPVVLQSSEPENAHKAQELGADFLDKDSTTLLDDLEKIVIRDLGFGDFIFRNNDGHEIRRASNIVEFEKCLQQVPDETLVYHGMRNHFSAWLIAHGDIDIARRIQPMKVGDFHDRQQLRDYLRTIFHEARTYRDRGKIVDFAPHKLEERDQVLRLADGSLGGKGRGLAFLNAILAVTDIQSRYPDLEVRLPVTAIIGTREFERILAEIESVDDISEEQIQTIIMEYEFTHELRQRLVNIVEGIDKPLAVRSSGLLEDSQSVPVAGLYKTFMIPNSHFDTLVRLDQLEKAIKRVYLSVFSSTTIRYLKSLHYRFEEEKMAVIIQEVAGSPHEQYFYPAATGYIQSYNRTACRTRMPSKGIAVWTLGMSGEEACDTPRFVYNPADPDESVICEELGKRSFLAIDRSETSRTSMVSIPCEQYACPELLACEDRENPQFRPLASDQFRRVADALREVMLLGRKSLGQNAELEFAVDFSEKPVLSILQIRPLAQYSNESPINIDKVDDDDILVFTQNSVGNGIYTPIRDIAILPEEEIDNVSDEDLKRLNHELPEDYILIIPASWTNRSDFKAPLLQWIDVDRARLIIETTPHTISVPRNRHFIQNLIAMNTGYATIALDQPGTVFHKNLIDSSTMVNRYGVFRHYTFEEPLAVILDGREGSLTVCRFKPHYMVPEDTR